MRQKTGEAPKGDLIFLSSNYELYGDMSRRVIQVLRERAAEVEQYSIDEAFVRPPTTEYGNLMEYGRSVRAQVLKWVGIPCGVGFAATKTLAKIANHIGKKRPEGVFVMLAAGCNVYAQVAVRGMFESGGGWDSSFYWATVVFFGLERAGAAYQADLFAEARHEASPLYSAIDTLNARLGKGKVFMSAEGVGERSWQMRRAKLSPHATTRWDELLTVR